MRYRYRITDDALVDEMMEKADELRVMYYFDGKDPDSTVLELFDDGPDGERCESIY
jgi:hypothetical protein